MTQKHLSLRINEELLHKLHVVSQFEGRSANSQLLVIIREAVEKFEKEYGEIKFP